MRLGIVGGEGKMGKLFTPIFERHVDEVITYLDPMETAKSCDIIVFSVPIETIEKVIEELLPHIKESHLLMDFTSLKEGPCKAMMCSKGSVVGLHPLFRPSVSSIEGQTIILCPLRPGTWLPWIRGLIKTEGAKGVEIEPKAHDEMMALVQSLVHFCSLLFAETLRQKGVDPKELLQMATLVYKMQLHIAGRILGQSLELYKAIQFENPHFVSLLKSFEGAFKTLREIVKKKDAQAFETFFYNCQSFLGKEILRERQKMTNCFIETMKEN